MNRNEAPDWNSSSAALLRHFLETGAGQVFLANLITGRPSLLVSTDNLNSVALKASEVAGYEGCINRLFFLTKDPEKEQTPHENYPDLDNNDAWDKQPKAT